METGDVVANIATLNERFRISEVDALIERKRSGAEKARLAGDDLPLHGPLLDALEGRLQAAHDKSPLPDEPTTTADLDDFVVRLRLGRVT